MRKSKEENLDTPITSMIDVVFLLIIFFVVTSAIEKEAVDEQIQLAKSVHLDPVTRKIPNQLTINVRPGGDVNLGDNFPLQMGQLRVILKNHKNTFGNAAPVVIRADGGVQFAEVDKVMVEVGAAGLYKISLAAEDSEE